MIMGVVVAMFSLGYVATPWTGLAWWHSVLDVYVGLILIGCGYCMGRYP